MLGRKALLLLTAVIMACGVSTRGDLPEPEDVPWGGKADGFDWGGTGSGSFSVDVEADALHTLGEIPADTKDVLIKVRASCDVDIQLLDGSTKVVHWKYGKVKGEDASSATYQGLEIAWSGYNGIDGPGDEDLEITGTMPNAMKVKLYALDACQVSVAYSWDAGTGPGPGPWPYKPFADRLADFAQKYPQRVILATKQGKPAIFLKTASLSGNTEIKAFYADLYATLGPNTLMAWNPAGENYFHLWTPNSTKLEERFRHKAMTVYGSPHMWDASEGNLDDEYGGEDDDYCYESCGEGCYEDCSDQCDPEEDIYDCQCYQNCEQECLDNCSSGDVGRERAVALIVLSHDQMSLFNDYMAAITDDPSTNLGPSEYNGGVPPYLSGDPDGKHNCTSWFSEWLNMKVSSQFPAYYNPASLMKSWTRGGWNGNLADRFRALLVFNHPNPPTDGDTISKDYPFDFGH